MNRIGVLEDTIAMKEIISSVWPNAETVLMTGTEQCVQGIMNEKIDGALLMSYTAQKLARDDTQNRFSVDIVSGSTLGIKMGINSELDDALENITTEGNYPLTMINSILDVNQLEHGHIELIHKPFNPEECMKDSMEILLPLAEKKEQRLAFSADIGGKIEVTLEALPDNRYRFTCTDNGIGMTPEYLQHICEDYSRAEDSQISATEGTGLGMSVVKGFTELMRGTLQVESELGKGSTFIVEIPFDEPSIRERELVMSPKEEQDQVSEEFKGKKVLLVEDNALNAEIAMELLQSIGLSVELAENGKIAVEKFEQSEINEYFAVFMDMQMPVMNGIEATKRIRASRRADKNVLILAMTANTLARDRKSCEEAGMNGYISKPVNLKDIGNTLREYI